ncbi:helix-turn-helix transcriptional regulator [Paenibacillus larvae]
MDHIRSLRKQKELSGNYIADKMGISPQYYYDIEKGKRNLTYENAAKLADILEVPVNYLLDKASDTESNNQIEHLVSKKKGPNRIRSIRKKKNISGFAIADKLGISAQHYYSIERGTRTLNVETAIKLAEIFDVSIDYLLGVSNEEKDQSKKTRYLSDEEMKKVPISDLENYRLEYKGKELTNEQKKHVIELLKHALEMNKEN